MKCSLFTALNVALFLAAGCSSTPTNVDTGAIHANTFSFIVPGPGNVMGIADSREQMHKLVQEAITKNLANRGVHRVPSGGDITVAYMVIIGNNATTESISTYFGYGRDAGELANKANDAYNNSKNPNYFEAGTLLVDILDTRTNKLLKRSYVMRPLLNNPTAEVRQERIQEAVDAVLKDAQISPGSASK